MGAEPVSCRWVNRDLLENHGMSASLTSGIIRGGRRWLAGWRGWGGTAGEWHAGCLAAHGSDDRKGQAAPEKETMFVGPGSGGCMELTHRISYLRLNRRDPVTQVTVCKALPACVSPSFPFPLRELFGGPQARLRCVLSGPPPPAASLGLQSGTRWVLWGAHGHPRPRSPAGSVCWEQRPTVLSQALRRMQN